VVGTALKYLLGSRGWTTITDTLWASTSCNSRAMRACSSTAAR
jgi:hypothetical protein